MPTGWLIAFTVIYFISGAIMCPVSKAVADDKGYNGTLFVIATLLFSGIGLLCACVLPDKKSKNNSEELKTLNENIVALTEAVKKLSEEKNAACRPAFRSEEPAPVRKEVKEEIYRTPKINRTPATANLVFKDGRLVCSACGGRIGFNDKTCPSCGAAIVPAEDSEGGFFKKK